MTYGLGTNADIDNGASDFAKQLRRSRTTARAWTILDRAKRLAVVECALSSANNDCADGFPLAL